MQPETEQLKRAVRRWKAVAISTSAALGLVVLLAAGLLFITAQEAARAQERETQARDEAEAARKQTVESLEEARKAAEKAKVEAEQVRYQMMVQLANLLKEAVKQ